MEKIADNELINKMIADEERITCRRQDGQELSFTMGYQQQGQLAALLCSDNQREGYKWTVYDSKGAIIKAPEIETRKPHYFW